MRIIDTHQHVFWHARGDSALAADMDAQGIERAWLLTWEIPATQRTGYNPRAFNPEHLRPDGSHPGIPLCDGIRARDRFAGRFVLGYCPDPSLDCAVEVFQAACQMHGVRVCGEWKFRMLLDDPRCLNLFDKAGELGCPVVLHLDLPYLPKGGQGTFRPDWYGGGMDNLARALEACPRTTFIGHAPGFWRHISGDADTAELTRPTGPVVPGGRLQQMFDRHPNLMADLSAGSGLTALSRDAAHARDFLIRYADRLLFGRDYYGGDLQAFLKPLDLPQAVQAKIFFENALRLVPC